MKHLSGLQVQPHSLSERLLRTGARVKADTYRGTPLTWAAARNRSAAGAWRPESRRQRQPEGDDEASRRTRLRLVSPG
jgi:hypothetical protein